MKNLFKAWMSQEAPSDAPDDGRVFVVMANKLGKPEDPLDVKFSKSEIERYELPTYISQLLIRILCALLAITFLWSAIAQVDIVAAAPATLIPQGDVKSIEPVVDGSIETVYVKDGQHVRAGDKLVLLDRMPYATDVQKWTTEETIAAAELERHKAAAEALQAIVKDPGKMPAARVEIDEVARIIDALYTAHSAQEEAGRDVSASGDAAHGSVADTSVLLSEIQNLQAERKAKEDALELRKKGFGGKKQELISRAAAAKRELGEAKEQLQTAEKILDLSKQQTVAYKTSFDAGALSRIEYLNSLRSLSERQVELQKQQARVAAAAHASELAQSAISEYEHRARADLSQAQAEISQLRADTVALQLRLRDTERRFKLSSSTYEGALEKATAAEKKETSEIALQQQRLEQARASLKLAQHIYDEAELKAPVEGIVTGLKVRGFREVVKRGELLMTIVPTNTPLIVEARVPNKDSGFIVKGQRAKLKFEAFPFQDYGVINGTVYEVEAHARESQSGSYYAVRIRPERTYFVHAGKKIQLTSGMAVTAEIITRRRTVLSTFCDPFKNILETQWN